MDYLAAAGIAALIAIAVLFKQGKKSAGRVIINSETTVWPIVVVIFASLTSLIVAAVAASAELSPVWWVVLAGGSWFVVALLGRSSKTGTRLVYDRGNRSFSPGQVVTSIGLFFLIFYWMVEQIGS